MRIILKTPDFHLENTMDSGQVFGFEKEGKVYEGRIGGKRLKFHQEGGCLHLSASVPAGAVERYFDLERDLSPVYAVIAADPKLAPLGSLAGLRLIRQDAWEGLACFILSSNNNVKRIQYIWRSMVKYFDGFPSALQIARSHESILRYLGLGYRAPFLWATAKFVAHNPACLDHIREAEYAEAVERVIAFPGIGPKVADCVLLYAFQKYEAFPVDVWMLRAMRKLYFNNRRVSEKRVQEFGQKRWKGQAGYVQQYIFHGIRSGVL